MVHEHDVFARQGQDKTESAKIKQASYPFRPDIGQVKSEARRRKKRNKKNGWDEHVAPVCPSSASSIPIVRPPCLIDARTHFENYNQPTSQFTTTATCFKVLTDNSIVPPKPKTHSNCDCNCNCKPQPSQKVVRASGRNINHHMSSLFRCVFN